MIKEKDNPDKIKTIFDEENIKEDSDKNLNDFLPGSDVESSHKEQFKDFDSNLNLNKINIVDALKTVFDPEIPVNIYDLGLIYNINILNNFDVEINMTLTAPNCPVAGEMPIMVANSIKKLRGFKSVCVNLVWEPPWTKEMMSDDAKLALDIS
tara:strand:+ start:542 stop:1000 length:459 start_codon:yes stop_codon:yes gene_type:complete